MGEHTSRFLEAVDQAKARIREVSIEDVKLRLERKDRFYLLDVREQNEWMAGHIPGAHYLGKGIIERDIEHAIADTTAEIVLYCGGGYRSALAADSLTKMGYEQVTSLAGGMGAWLEASLPVAHPDPPPGTE
jgi:rhodanese-related sulfurtransferase